MKRRIMPDFGDSEIIQWSIKQGNNTLLIVLNNDTGVLSAELFDNEYQPLAYLSQEQIRYELRDVTILG